MSLRFDHRMDSQIGTQVSTLCSFTNVVLAPLINVLDFQYHVYVIRTPTPLSCSSSLNKCTFFLVIPKNHYILKKPDETLYDPGNTAHRQWRLSYIIVSITSYPENRGHKTFLASWHRHAFLTSNDTLQAVKSSTHT